MSPQPFKFDKTHHVVRMSFMLAHIIENTLYFLALLNPVSKILFLTSKQPAYSPQELRHLSVKATIAALAILLLLASFGNFLLRSVFHVEIYSLSVAGGIILFTIGISAVRTGSFFGKIDEYSNKDISIVPLAAPLIAGPGTMAAAISFASIHGKLITIICITIALSINLVFMMFSLKINSSLTKLKATEPLIRITGLIVTAVAMQMIFNGCSTWFGKII